ncbi:hypothetical protein SANA_00910 [Gottschalkiaceae bacterium SANA]|nr:hypothetical protein SANA_00910 [Gottschalkiaceae bacterium SANA]
MTKNSEERSIGKWVSILYRQFQIYINRALDEYDINSSEYIFLINISKNQGVNQKMLSEELIIDQALTTRVMKSLEEKGYITRAKNSHDRRAYQIFLTEKGEKIQPIILGKLKAWTDILANDLTVEEVDQGIAMLMVMSKNAVQENRGGNED